MFFQLFGFRFAYPFDDVGRSIHHAHQRAVLVVHPDVDVVEHELLARAEVGGIARRLRHHQLAVAMCGVEQFGSAAADVFFHFDAGFEQIVVVEFQLGVISVEVESVQYNRFRYYSPEMGIYISSDPIGLAGGFNTYAYVKDTNTWVDVLGLSGELVYQLIRDNKVVYYGITSRTALERMAEHGKTKVFDNMEILADGLTHDQARSIEGALIRQRLKERADDWSDFDSIKARLDKSGLDNRNRGRIKERWTSENPLDDLRDKIYKKPKKVKVGCKS